MQVFWVQTFSTQSYPAQTFSNWANPAACASSELLRACSLLREGCDDDVQQDSEELFHPGSGPGNAENNWIRFRNFKISFDITTTTFAIIHERDHYLLSLVWSSFTKSPSLSLLLITNTLQAYCNNSSSPLHPVQLKLIEETVQHNRYGQHKWHDQHSAWLCYNANIC